MNRRPSDRAATGRRAIRVLCICAVVGVGLLAGPLIGQPLEPTNGPKHVDPGWHALTGATLIAEPGKTIENATIVMRHGVITSVEAGGAVPSGAREWDYTGLTLYAGLVEPYVEVEAADPDPDAPGTHWNVMIKAQRSALDGEGLGEEGRKKLRSMGYGAAMIAPQGGIFRGMTAVVSLGEEVVPSDPLARVIAADVYHAAGLDTAGFRSGNYPSSKMGAIALVRQTLADAGWHARAMAAHRLDPTAHERPAPDDASDALRNTSRILWEVDSELDILRVEKLSKEFGRKCAIVGSGDEFKRLDAVVEAGCPLIVPLVYPEKPKVSTLSEREAVDLRDLMDWEAAPTNAARLVAAGATVALTSSKVPDKQDFQSNLCLAIEGGLSEDDALAMLTTVPAQLLSLADRLGKVEPGMIANLVVVKGTMFEEDREIRDVWVDGERYEIKAAPDVELEGKWDVALGIGGDIGQISGTFKIGKKNAITFERKKLASEIEAEKAKAAEAAAKADEDGEDEGAENAPDRRRPGRGGRDGEPRGRGGDDADDNTASFKAKGVKLTENRLDFQLDAKAVGLEDGTLSLSALIEDDMFGVGILPSAAQFSWSAARAAEDDEADEDADKNDEEGDDDSDKDENSKKRFAGIAESFGLPFGPYALSKIPDQPEVLIVRNATIWTSGPVGIIENGEMEIHSGKIAYVGPARKIEIPAGATVIDARGKHVTPGLIDCHSHTGFSGGVNEGAQTVTAEVSAEDVINPDSINFYRELGGGLTAMNRLHGSANPIGGQNSVVKNRWGARRPDDLRLQGATPGIKFALGENVKRSRGSNPQTRYPATRMGVETMIRDRFTAAREYAQEQAKWNALSESERARGVPPRTDYELQTLAQILAGERLVHCHSYRQDEILMLCRVAEDFGFKIGTFQHVLEGYKVADAIRDNAIGGSTFSDWWAYKMEVVDAIPSNGAIMHDVGVVVTFNSDSDELARRMNWEAAKAVKYGGVEPSEALKFVTLNAAIQLQVDDRIGSLEVDKDADFAIWSGDPLSTMSRCVSTWVDGREYFSLEKDMTMRQTIKENRERIIQKVLASADPKPKGKPGAGGMRGRMRGRGHPTEVAGLGLMTAGQWLVPIPADELEALREQAEIDRLYLEYNWMITNGIDAGTGMQGDCGCSSLGQFDIHNH